MVAPELIIAKAMDAWRIRLWLHKGPRCPCHCGERVPWSAVKVEAFEGHGCHISTERRPVQGECDIEETYIPSTLEGFRAYLVERRHVLDTYKEMLWCHCVNKDEDWVCTLLSNGHVTKSWQVTSVHEAHYNVTKLFQLVKYNWFKAANIVLSWPSTIGLISEEDMMYLVKEPYRTGYEFMDGCLSVSQRNWLLCHTALDEVSRNARVPLLAF